LVQNTPLIGAILVRLAKTLFPSNRPPQHDTRKTLNSRAPTTSSGMVREGGPSIEHRGIKRSTLGPKIVHSFCLKYTRGTSSSSLGVVGTHGINADGVIDSNKRRKVKRIVTIQVDGMIDLEVCNIFSTVEEFAPNSYDDEDEVCGDDEESNGLDDSHAEVPNDADSVVRTSLETARTRKNARRHSPRKKKD